MITFDTYAWIEFLEGSKKGELAKEYFQGSDPLFTPTICLAEIKTKLLKDKIPEGEQRKTLKLICSRSLLMPLDSDIALKAAELKHGGLPIVDSVIYATALRNGTKLLTGDNHFREYEGVVFME